MSEINFGSTWTEKLREPRVVAISSVSGSELVVVDIDSDAEAHWYSDEFRQRYTLNTSKDDSANQAADILADALAAMSERGQSYDTLGDGKERSMAKVVEMFNTLTGANLTTEQGWDFMILLKLVRASQGYKSDNYVDGSAYFALAGESAGDAK